MIKIKNRFTDNLICEEALGSIKELVEKNKANLRDANLRGADLREADLREANLIGANLIEADLREANLGGAYLIGANLEGANLIEADLIGAYLREANLIGVDLRGAYLRGANLIEADLRGANLRGAVIENKSIKNYKDITGVGKQKRQLRCFYLDDKSFYFMAGCFSGTEKELKEAVTKKYGEDCEYMEAIKFLKRLCKEY